MERNQLISTGVKCASSYSIDNTDSIGLSNELNNVIMKTRTGVDELSQYMPREQSKVTVVDNSNPIVVTLTTDSNKRCLQ